MPQLVVDRSHSALWTVTLSNPPINLTDAEMIYELLALVAELETASLVRVVVFRSANPDFFLAHWSAMAERWQSGLASYERQWSDVLNRLVRLEVISIAEICGRVCGAGSDLVLSCDLRFASSERFVTGPFRRGSGLMSNMTRFVQMVGSSRAMELSLSARPISAALAQRYGYVNRTLPDAELTPFVDALALRMVAFKKSDIGRLKALVRGKRPLVEVGPGYVCSASPPELAEEKGDRMAVWATAPAIAAD